MCAGRICAAGCKISSVWRVTVDTHGTPFRRFIEFFGRCTCSSERFSFGSHSNAIFKRFSPLSFGDFRLTLLPCTPPLNARFCSLCLVLRAKPWCEVSLQQESSTIGKELAAINRRGYLTINSQVNVEP